MAKKILIVDDDPVIVRYLETLFGDNGYDTCSAGDGLKAFDLLKTENPDLITLDLEMPQEWGPQFFKRMSREKTLKDTPVIIISGLPGRHLAVKSVVAALSKPFDPDKLLGIVRKTLGE